MERMTVMTPKGAALKMDDEYLSEDAARTALMEKYRAAIDRLAAYENTGLEPEEITIGRPACVFYRNRQCNLNGDFCAEGPGCPFELDGARARKFLLQITQSNDPLTLEELRKMSWEPAWVDGDRETKIGHSGWAIVWYSKVEKYVCVWWPAAEYADIPSLDSYGNTWWAYRHKPEGVAND